MAAKPTGAIISLCMAQNTRLLCRCIQRADQPIILTGYAALNKLLGREVYTSHMQLGGPKASNRNPSGMQMFVSWMCSGRPLAASCTLPLILETARRADLCSAACATDLPQSAVQQYSNHA